MLRVLQRFQVQLKASSYISDGAFPEPPLILPSIFPCLYCLIFVPCSKRKLRKEWILPSTCLPMTNLHRIIQWCRWRFLAEWGLSGQSTKVKRWGIYPKMSASFEGQGSNWPWLPTASSSWREISHQKSFWGSRLGASLKGWGGMGHLRLCAGASESGLCGPAVLQKPCGCTAMYDLSPADPTLVLW